jgi:ATP-dependent helicase HrpB
MTDTSPTRVQGSSDLLIRLDQVSRGPASRLKNDLERMVRRITPKRQIPPDESALLQLILLAYPDRVARRRAGDPEAAVMVGGGGLRLARESVVRTAEFFIAVEARQDDRSSRGEAMVRLASAIEPAWLEECFPGSVVRTVAAKFDEKRRRVVGTTRTCYLDLVLSEQSDAAVDSETAGKVLAAALASEAVTLFATNDQAAGLLARIEFLRKWMPEHPWPTFDAAALQTALIDACRNKRSADELNGNALAQSLMTRLPYPLNRLLDQNAPESIPVPSGKQIRIQYDATRPPVLAVRLQELFGWKSTPRLAVGRVALVLELLGPNFRPVQVTDDLASFWANAYFQVRKDLKRRYPKHSWPDDPLTAPAEARGGGRRMKG